MAENKRRILQRDSSPHLFRPIEFRSVIARNRVMMSPMCQYSATDGMPEEWHHVHLCSRAIGGAGIVFTEATHVSPEGRITPNCLGIWNDDQRDAFTKTASFIAEQGAVPAMQIGHAGRKASTSRPWEGASSLSPKDPGGWQTIAPTEQPYADWHAPKAMDPATIERVLDDFTAAARRALEAGFKVIEIHAAHGYLAHSFLSPLSNDRTDEYGGSMENRARFLMATLDAVRKSWPSELPLFLRLSCSDWAEGGLTLEDTVKLVSWIRDRRDVDLIDCSSGGNDPRQRIPSHPGYQVPFAEKIKRETGMKTAAVGLLHSPDFCEEVIANGRADLVALGRTLLADPYWPLHAATKLRAENLDWPIQYERSNIF
ncbi:MAG: NADH:flavin oxidoreductase/NADH oxidase [Pseudomonadota bacterium]|nr:NADH:flavin oxidoreductase/NADH oxidase [Pseudomonadota bacterium]